MSTIIPINKKYQIKLENNLWVVCKRSTSDNILEATWKPVSINKTLQKAGEWLILRMTEDDELDCVDDIINALHRATLLICTAIMESDFVNES